MGLPYVSFLNRMLTILKKGASDWDMGGVIIVIVLTDAEKKPHHPNTREVEVCPDNLHQCSVADTCCQKDNGNWGCCRKVTVPIILGECCHQFLWKWVCCNDTSPKCRYFGCDWS